MSVHADMIHGVTKNRLRSRRRLAMAALWFVGTSLVAFCCVGSSVISSMGVAGAYDGPIIDPDAELTSFGILVAFIVMLAPITLYWRSRVPWLPVAAGLLATVVVGLDGLLPLVGAAALLGRRRGRIALLWVGAAFAAALWAGIRDGLRPSDRSVIVYAFDLGGESAAQPAQFVAAMVVTVVAIGAALSYGLIRRAKRDVAAADRRTQGERRTSRSLSTQVARQDERERLAREVHDALAHRLSLISLQSQSLGALTHSADPAVATAATALQGNAHKSLDDLRNLIGVLREPAAASPRPEPETPMPHNVGLTDLDDLIDTSRRAGMQINSSIQLTDIDGANPLLDKAAYRVVQESLTNVHKHSPSAPVRLWVRAESGNGVLIRVVNRLDAAAGPLADSGAGAGVVGMRERAAMLGGTATIGPDGAGNFLVDVHLPWLDQNASAVGAAGYRLSHDPHQ